MLRGSGNPNPRRNPMMYHTKKGVPLSNPLCEVLALCESNGMELKPLALGVRIVGTDVVASDNWNGLYLCKSGGRGLERKEYEGAVLRPADKGQWCVSLPNMAKEPEEAKVQAAALLTLASQAGYFLPELKVEKKPSAEEATPKEGAKGKGRRKKAQLDEALKEL
jgi:hypothetical protein